MTRHTRWSGPLGLALAGVLLAACSSGNYTETPLPAPSASPTSASAAPSTPVAPPCDNATQSYDPLPSIPATSSIDDPGMSEIIDRGYLTVGVSADTLLLGARNPITGKVEGFDIDFARSIAEAIFGNPDKIRLKVITASQRIPALQDNDVDMVARNMSMTCARWKDIAFSSEYYHSGQKVLITRPKAGDEASAPKTLGDLSGKTVCAPTGTSSLDKLRTFPGVKIVTADNHTGCLVLFQQGKADAITGDDTVLAGLAAQDPYAVVTDAPAITDEPYGLGVAKGNVYFARYINAVLAQLRTDGDWTKIYNKWLAARLGKAPKPPTPVYGR